MTYQKLEIVVYYVYLDPSKANSNDKMRLNTSEGGLSLGVCSSISELSSNFNYSKL